MSRRIGAIILQTLELIKNQSPTGSMAVTNELAAAVGEAVNRRFVSPDYSGSILHGAPNFNGSGASAAAVDADLRSLLNLVPGSFRPGAAFVGTPRSANFLSTLRDASGARAYPDVTPGGGELIGLPLFVTTACTLSGSPSRDILGLIDPNAIFYGDDGRVRLMLSTTASVKSESAPSSAAGSLVSLFQTGSAAIRAIREVNWATQGTAGAYFVVSGF